MTAATKEDIKQIHEAIKELFTICTENGKSVVRLETKMENLEKSLPKQPCEDVKSIQKRAEKIKDLERDVREIKKQRDVETKMKSTLSAESRRFKVALLLMILSPIVSILISIAFQIKS